MKTSIQINKANKTLESENKKRDRKVPQGMGSGLTPKQLI